MDLNALAAVVEPGCSRHPQGGGRPRPGHRPHAGRAAGRGARAARGRAWHRQDPARARPSRARSRCAFKRIQFTPDLMPGDIAGHQRLQLQQAQPVRAAPTGRSSPTSCSPTRSTARRPRRRPPCWRPCRSAQVTVDGVSYPLREPFIVHRHPEPDRAGGHLPAAGGAAGPLPVQGRDRVPDPRARARDREAAQAPPRRMPRLPDFRPDAGGVAAGDPGRARDRGGAAAVRSGRGVRGRTWCARRAGTRASCAARPRGQAACWRRRRGRRPRWTAATS